MKVQTVAANLAVSFLVTTSAVLAADRLVPGEYPTIQAAIDAALDGDTIIVASGTYYENTDFGEKSITLTSTEPNDPNVVAATIIDANGSGRAVAFPGTTSVDCILAGFTLTGGGGALNGGGIRCWVGTITINNCIVTGNSAQDGGGIYNDSAHLTVADCTFNGNAATSGNGGGIYSRDGPLTLTNCTFIGNSSVDEGGGLATDNNSVIVTNCTFTGNSARRGGGMNNSHWGATATNCLFSGNSASDGGGVATFRLYLGDLTLSNCTFNGNVADAYGGAVQNEKESNLTLTNCILWGNSAEEGPQIAMEEDGTLSISYCCLQGGELDVYAPSAEVNWPGGYIDDNPRFADESGGDYHLQSSAGRWDANTSVWVTDDNNSPCIDAGDPNSDWTGELWPHGKRINMGAFGGTPQASMSESDAGNIADLDFSGSVNWGDLKILTGKWLVEELLLSEDINRDGIVNSKDYAVFADNWGWGQ